MMRFVTIILIVCMAVSVNLFSGSTADFVLKVGNPAPSRMLFNFNDVIQGTDDFRNGVKFKDFFGKKAVVLSFFTKTCVNCKFEIPELQKIMPSYTNKNVQFFLILIKEADDTIEDLAAEMEKREYTIPILYHKFPDAILKPYLKNKKGAMNAVPLLYIIDRNGYISYIKSGFNKDAAAAEIKKIKAQIDIARKKPKRALPGKKPVKKAVKKTVKK
ncbi:peroxiredoxin family protein [Spirochaetota bacterium]